MKELTDILKEFDRARVADVDVALATVVRVQGSSYRRPGARMLITSDGRIVGGVSGGCLERDVVQRAGAVMATGKSVVVRYDTTPDFETGGGYSLGCGGTIDLLIESLRTPTGVELMQLLRRFHTGSPGVLATIVSPRNHPRLGTHAAIDDDSIEAGATELRMVDGSSEIFVEHLRPPLHLIIFGAGNDAVPLASLGSAMGWRVTVVDVRSAMVNLNHQWLVDAFHRCSIEDVSQTVSIGDFTAAVVMTHNFGHDRQLIGWLAREPLVFLGLLGARQRTAELLSQLDETPPLLHAPVGLDIGAANPEEVALSIAAEITAVIRGKATRTSNIILRPMQEQPCPVAGS